MKLEELDIAHLLNRAIIRGVYMENVLSLQTREKAMGRKPF